MRYKIEKEDILFTIDHQQSIEDFLSQFKLSRKTIHLFKQNKKVLLNEQYQSFDTIMQKDDVLSVKAYQVDDHMFSPTYGELDVVYEDNFILIVNKPAGINVYPSSQDKKDSLSNIVSYYYKKKKLNIPVRYIHRLDFNTSGLVLFVKCALIQPLLDYRLSIKEISRSYVAIVEGKIPVGQSKMIKGNISVDRHHASKMRVGKNGKDAKTHYKCIASNDDYSCVECDLLTGRKHQIRVHLSHIGHPILGDELYGSTSSLIDRQALHAYKLSFIHPITLKPIIVTCDVPDDMKWLTKKLDVNI